MVLNFCKKNLLVTVNYIKDSPLTFFRQLDKDIPRGVRAINLPKHLLPIPDLISVERNSQQALGAAIPGRINYHTQTITGARTQNSGKMTAYIGGDGIIRGGHFAPGVGKFDVEYW